MSSSKYTRMCEFHNKMSMRHMLEVNECDGWCNAADPCDFILSAVEDCKNCHKEANPSVTHKYINDDTDWYDAKTNRKVKYSVVERYACS